MTQTIYLIDELRLESELDSLSMREPIKVALDRRIQIEFVG